MRFKTKLQCWSPMTDGPHTVSPVRQILKSFRQEIHRRDERNKQTRKTEVEKRKITMTP